MGQNCYGTTIGDNCSNITMGNYCDGNSFGDNCSNITIDGVWQNNSIGRKCSKFQIKTGYSNIIGDFCSNITVISYLRYSNIENHCLNLTLDGNYSIVFRARCNNIIQSGHISNTVFEENNRFIHFTVNGSSAMNPWRHGIFKRGLLGTEREPIVITDNKFDQNYVTVYQPSGNKIVSIE